MLKDKEQQLIDDAYKQAVHWQQRAERFCSPAEFNIAADYYDKAGRYSEADYCRERAAFYSRTR